MKLYAGRYDYGRVNLAEAEVTKEGPKTWYITTKGDWNASAAFGYRTRIYKDQLGHSVFLTKEEARQSLIASMEKGIKGIEEDLAERKQALLKVRFDLP